jgi:hypothetical protein
MEAAKPAPLCESAAQTRSWQAVMPTRVALIVAPWPSALPLAQALVGKWPAGEKGVGRPYGFLSVGKNDDSRFEQLSLPNGAPQETDFRPLR